MNKRIIFLVFCILILDIAKAQERVHFDFSSLQFDTIAVKNSSFLLLSDKTLPFTTEVSGQPLIPCYNQLISLPIDSKIQVKYVISDLQTIKLQNGLRIYPKQPDLMKDKEQKDFVLDGRYYEFGEGNDTAAIKIKELGIAKDKKLYLIQVLPVAYLPLENTIVRYGAIDVSIIIENKENTITKSLATTARARKMLIVSPEMFREVLQPFVKWKIQEGINVVEVYPSDIAGIWDTTNIKQYLQSLWDNQIETEPFADFLLLCGDVAQLSPFKGKTNTHVTDLYYADYTSDGIADVLYGRFSAQNAAQMEAIVAKTIAYEKFNLNDISYLNSVLLVAGQESAAHAIIEANGQLNYLKNYVSNLDTAVYYNVSNDDSLLSGALHFNDVLDRLNAGNSFINYTSHCSSSGWSAPSISSNNILSMEENGKFGFYINNCCLSGKFDANQCFAEALQRAENKGAIGVISASNDTYWAGDWIFTVGNQAKMWLPPYDSTKLGMYDRMFHTHGEPRSEYAMTQAEIMQAGNLSVTLAQKDYDLYYREIYHLFGDPSLIPYIGIPQEQSAVLPSTLPLGLNNFTINVAPYSYVALSVDDSLVAAGRADSVGYFTLDFNPISESCFLRIVITCQGYKPLIDSILIQPLSTPYLAIGNQTFLSENQMTTTEFFCDSIYSLRFDLQNYGMQTATDVRVLLQTSNGFVPIDTSYSIGNLAYGQSVLLNNVLKFKLNIGLYNGMPVCLPVKIVANEFTTNDTLPLLIYAPDLVIENIILNTAEPNSSIAFDVVNIGRAASTSGIVELSELSTNIVLTNGSSSVLNSILPKSKQTFTFPIDFSADTNYLKDISFKITAVVEHYQTSSKYENLNINDNLERFETANFSLFEWQSEDKAWVIDSITRYEGQYSARSNASNNDEISSILISLDVIADDEVSFFTKTSTEKNYDKFYFYIDGVKMLTLSGEHDWQQYSFAIGHGKHTFKWSYIKDGSFDFGADAVWIDKIKLPRTASVSGFSNLEKAKDIMIYPNPATDVLKIENITANSNIYIMDMSGKILLQHFESKASQISINIREISNGFYMVCIRSNETLSIHKLVIAR
jgi:hypothetical protein